MDTSIRFVNQSGGRVQILWEQNSHAEIYYNELNDGDGYLQPTYVGHWWCVRRESDGELLLRCCGQTDEYIQRISSTPEIASSVQIQV